VRFIVACCWSPDKGQGISTMAREIAEYLISINHEVFYLSPEAVNKSWYKETGVQAINIGPELRPKDGLIAVVTNVEKINPDVLINNDHPYVQAALPVINTKKIIISHTMAWGTAALSRFNHQYADKIVSISYDMLKYILERNVSPAKLLLIMNGIVDPYYSDWKPANKVDTKINLVFAGNWTKVKGADVLLKAINDIADDVSWLKLDCFGSIKNKIIHKLRNKSWIKLHGRVERESFLEILSNADFLLFPSKVEGCPMTVIEAMSRGVVPLVSDGKGAMRWMIDHGVDGYVLRRKKWKKDMWEILNYMNSNPGALIEMKQKARKRFLSPFTIEHMMSSLLTSVNEVVSQKYQRDEITAIKWHRQKLEGSLLERITERLYYRMGVIRKAGKVKREDLKSINL